jgi:DNA-binding MarR family transcriptional regulator
MDGLSREGPSLAELADAVGLDVSNVKRNLRRLEEAGWIFRSGGRGRGVVTIYQLTIPVGAEAALEAVLNRGAGAPLTAPKVARESQESGALEDQKWRAAVLSDRALPVSLKEQPADGARSGAPSPWSWSGRTLRQWMDLSPVEREGILAAYMAASPRLGETESNAPDLEALAGEVTA